MKLLRSQGEPSFSQLLIARVLAIALALTATLLAGRPSSAQEVWEAYQGHAPADACGGVVGRPGTKFCSCKLLSIRTKIDIRNVTISGILPIGTRVHWAYIETVGGVFDGGFGKHYLSKFREVFLSSGQYISLNESMSLRSASTPQPMVYLVFEGETPVKSKLNCSWSGYTSN
jgi:hypothetical protein